jgi:hypothetical protein
MVTHRGPVLPVHGGWKSHEPTRSSALAFVTCLAAPGALPRHSPAPSVTSLRLRWRRWIAVGARSCVSGRSPQGHLPQHSAPAQGAVQAAPGGCGRPRARGRPPIRARSRISDGGAGALAQQDHGRSEPPSLTKPQRARPLMPLILLPFGASNHLLRQPVPCAASRRRRGSSDSDAATSVRRRAVESWSAAEPLMEGTTAPTVPARSCTGNRFAHRCRVSR